MTEEEYVALNKKIAEFWASTIEQDKRDVAYYKKMLKTAQASLKVDEARLASTLYEAQYIKTPPAG
jgi:hypothetical protein